MKKHISKDTWSQIKGKYVAGKQTVTQIADDHEISRKSIQRKAKKEGWVFGSSKDDVSHAVANATIETIIREDIEAAVKVTEKFLKDSEKLRCLAMAIIDGMRRALETHGGNIPADEANRLLACQRANEVGMKTITGIYTSQRKALGLDIDDDIEKAKRIKGNDKQQAVDPLDGMTEEDIDKQLKEYE